MVADFHSSISKGPEMKTGGVRCGLPGRCSRTDGQQKSRVHVANALDNCEPPTPQTSPVNYPRRERGRKTEREKGGGVQTSCCLKLGA